MEAVFLKMLFIVSASAQFGKHVYVPRAYSWTDAQKYCRDNYTDLSPLETSWEARMLKSATAGRVNGQFWIGLYQDTSSRSWRWSGGGLATYIPWNTAQGQPSGGSSEVVAGAICWHNCPSWSGWHDSLIRNERPFFCLRLSVQEDLRTWEEALTHCKQTHTTLASLASETQHLLAMKEIQRADIFRRVWVGLRYLGDRWLWVGGEPLVYEAWTQEDHQCPMWKRCGALNTAGEWESWDCEDKLSFICY